MIHLNEIFNLSFGSPGKRITFVFSSEFKERMPTSTLIVRSIDFMFNSLRGILLGCYNVHVHSSHSIT